tara:strand:- start:1282 stop:1530 length:249 start_codon:yes stop_codon:yes gene_type:complete
MKKKLKDLEHLMATVNDEDWVLVITPDGQLKTVLMPKDKSAMTYTVKQVLGVAESGIEEMIASEFEEEFPHLAQKFNKKTLH